MRTIRRVPVQDLAAGGILGGGIGAVMATIAIKRGSGLAAAIGAAVAVAATSAAAIHNARCKRTRPSTKVEAMVRAVNSFRSR